MSTPISIIPKGCKAIATKLGQEYIFTYFVTSLPNKPFNLLLQGQIDPVSALRIPIINESSQDVAGAIVLEVEAIPFPVNSRTSALVTVRVGPPELGADPNVIKIDIGSSSGNKTIYRDPNGAPLIIKYLPPNSTRNDQTQTMPFSYQDFTPSTIIRFTKTLPYCPLRLNKMFRNTVNRTTWNGFPPSTALCRNIQGSSIQGGLQYITVFEFECDYSVKASNPKIGPWDKMAYYLNPIDGTPPPDVLNSIQMGKNPLDGSKGAWLLKKPQTDFNQLQLPTIDT